jgi:mannose-6-phosphate isomerase-like protein (cupin superfamily)
MSDKRLLVTIGLKNIVVVSTDDSVFLAHRGKSELVKHLSKKLKDRKQISDPKEKKYSWGKSFVIEDTNGYRLTKLSIKPKNELKMLKEEVASKELLILKGNVKVKTNEKEIILNENQRFFPDKQEYSLLNIGDEYLEILDIEFYISKKKILEKIIKKRDYTPINKN